MTTTHCARCGASVVRASSGNWVTGRDGWILPSHLNTTCDGIHLHRVHEAREEVAAMVTQRYGHLAADIREAVIDDIHTTGVSTQQAVFAARWAAR